jgi:hypothetical protein
MESVVVFVHLLVAIVAQQCAGQWYDYNPSGSVDNKGIYQEVWSRCTPANRRTAQADNVVTTCHEATHMLNSQIREKLGGGKLNAFYVGKGKCFALPEPDCTLTQARQYVTQFRNSTYQLYFVEQAPDRSMFVRGWDSSPLYIFDEWSAYINGAQAAKELLGYDPHGTYDRARWFCHYADAVVECIKNHDPDYEHIKELESFVAYQKERTEQITEKSHGAGPAGVAHIPLEWRQRNRAGSCVHASTKNMLRYLGQHELAEQYWNRSWGGEWPSRHQRKLSAAGIDYMITTDGDDSLLEWAIENRRPIGVTYGRAHFINCLGRDEAGNAVLLGNHDLAEYRREPWQQFLTAWRSAGGWAVVLLGGAVPPPTPG